MSDPHINWSAVELANKRREKDGRSVPGGFSVVIGLSCWFFGTYLVLAEPIPAFSILFGIGAIGGVAVGIYGIRNNNEESPFRTLGAFLGVVVNLLFLFLVSLKVIAWLISVTFTRSSP